MKKRLFSVILILAMFMTMLPPAAFAAAPGEAEIKDELVITAGNATAPDDEDGGTEEESGTEQEDTAEEENRDEEEPEAEEDDGTEEKDEGDEPLAAAQPQDIALATYSGGTGTADDPYKISTPADMWTLAETSDDWGKCFVLTADIDLGGDPWTTIGNNDKNKAFTGTFDGGGKKISGLNIYNVSDNQGLFGNVNKGVISDLHVSGTVVGGGNVGGIVGMLDNSGRVVNCSFEGSVGGTGLDGTDLALGGIVGHNHNGEVIGCRNSGTVDCPTMYAGGIVGQNEGGYARVENCENSGTITISAADASNAGGIVGCNIVSGKVINCRNFGTVDGTGSHGRIGGIAGQNNSAGVSLCYNSGPVTGSTLVGGIVGQNTGAGTISECYNTASVSGSTQVGGVAGANEGGAKVTNCYNAGGVSGTNAGGVVGYNYGGSSSKSATRGTVENCYSRGTVSSGGGIVGLNTGYGTSGRVTNNYYLTGTAAGGINSDNVAGQAEAKTEDEFASGEVAWLLQHPQNGSGLIWVQEVVKTDKDAYPLLNAFSTSPRVLMVSFLAQNETKKQVYTNAGAKIAPPANVTPSEKHVFYQWRVGDVDGEQYVDTVKEEFAATTIDTVNVVAVQRELFGGEQNEITVTGTYSLDAQQLMVNLNGYVVYAGGSGTGGNFSFSVKTDNDGLKGTLASDGSYLTVPAKTPAKEDGYLLTVTAHEEQPMISTLSLTEPDTKDVDLTVRVIIRKVTPDVTVTAAAIDFGKALADSGLTGTATHPGRPDAEVKGSFAWEDGSKRPTVAEGAGGFPVIFTPADGANYNSVTVTVPLTVNKVSGRTVTAPTANDRTYDSTIQALLLTPGTAEGGTMVYRLGEEGDFTETIPSRANASEYTIYYKVQGDENHEDSEVKSLKATISPYPLTMEAQTVVYNGTKTLTLELRGVGSETVFATVTAGSPNRGTYNYTTAEETGENEYTVTLDGSFGANYTVESAGTLEIKPRPVTLQWTDGEGNAQLTFTHSTGKTYTVIAAVTDGIGDDQFHIEYDTDTANKIQNSASAVGSYTARVKSLGNENYTLEGVENASQPWRINKESDVITLTAAEKVTYGEPLKLTATITPADGGTPGIEDGDVVEFFVNGVKIGEAAVEQTGQSGMAALTIENVTSAYPAYAFSAGQYAMRADYSGNENVDEAESAAITVTVEPRPVQASIVSTTGEAAPFTKVFDGTVYATGLTIKLSGVLDCDGEVTAAAESFTYNDRNVDSAESITANNVQLRGTGCGNYTLDTTKDVTADGEITPKPVELEWHNGGDTVYDGSERNVYAVATGLVSDEPCQVEMAGGNGRDVGKYEAKATIKNTNYVLSDAASATLPYEITPKELVIPAQSVPYDGNQEFEVTIETGINGDTVTVTLIADSPNVGEYSYSTGAGTLRYTVSAPELKNYKIVNGEPLTIEKVKAELTAPTPNDLTYSGLAQALVSGGSTEDGTLIVSFLLSGDDPNEVPAGTAAGDYEVFYWVKGDENHYDTEPQSIWVTIKQAPLDIEHLTYTYDGGSVFTVELAGVNSETVTVTLTTSAPDADDYVFAAAAQPGTKTYTAVLSSTNYTLGNKQMLTIEPKAVEVSWSGYEDLVYKGTAVDVTATVVVGLIGDDECTVIVEDGKMVNAGDYVARAIRLSNSNYKLSGNTEQPYTIARAPLTVPEKTFTYNGGTAFPVELQGVNGETVFADLVTESPNVGKYDCPIGEQTVAKKYTVELAEAFAANYTVVGAGTLEIEPRPVTLKWTSSDGQDQLTFTYDGKTEFSVIATVVNAVKGDEDKFALEYKTGEIEGVKYTNSETLAGGYTAEVISLGNPNYTLAGAENLSQPWRINKASEVITLIAVKSAADLDTEITNVTYGNSLTLKATITPKDARSISLTADEGEVEFFTNGNSLGTAPVQNGVAVLTIDEVSSAAFFSAGPIPLRADYGGTDNTEEAESDAITITVDPKPLTASIVNTDDETGPFTKVYDSTDYAAGLKIELDGVLTCDGEVTATAESYTYDKADVSAKTITANNIRLSGANSSNYTVAEKVTADGKITPKPVVLQWHDYTDLVYDGKEKNVTAEANGMIGDEACKVTVENGNGRDAGDYDAKATLDNPNYTLAEGDEALTYTIAPAELTVPAQSFPYNGSRELEVTMETGINNEKVTVTLTAGSANAGEYNYSTDTAPDDVTYTVSASDSKNYRIVNGGTLTITKVDPEFTAPEVRELTYTGLPQALVTGGSTKDGTLQYSFVESKADPVETPEGTAAGKYEVYYWVKGDENHNDSELRSVTVTIKPAPLNIGPLKVTYDGGTEFTVDVNGVNGETVTVTLTTSAKDAGDYGYTARSVMGTYTAAFDDSNYTLGETKTVTIEPKTVEAQWSGYDGLVYTGSAVNVTATVVDGLVEGDECDLTVENGQKINAGKYTAKATVSNPNYKLSAASAERPYTIDPAPLTVPDHAVTYNGKTTFTVKVEGVNGETVNVTLTASSPNAGSYQFAKSAAKGRYTASSGNSNYTVINGGTLTIKADPNNPNGPTDPETKKYTVTFDPNGGKCGTGSMTTKEDGKLPSLPTATKQGVYFAGWYTAKEGGNKVTTDTVFKEDTTVYAHWSNVPVTGDTNQLALWLWMLGLSGAALGFLLRKKKADGRPANN